MLEIFATTPMAHFLHKREQPELLELLEKRTDTLANEDPFWM